MINQHIKDRNLCKISKNITVMGELKKMMRQQSVILPRASSHQPPAFCLFVYLFMLFFAIQQFRS